MHLHGLPHYFSKVVHHHHPESSVLFHTSPLDTWPHELATKPDRFVSKLESCSAHPMTPAQDEHGPVVDKAHYHTFLRATLAPTEGHPKEETVFVERVLLRQDEPTHSVIPVASDAAPTSSSDASGDALYDHACVVLEGKPSSLLHTHHVYVDRTLDFRACPDRRLSLYELATLLAFVSARGLRAVSIGVDTACETYSKWFSRAVLSALAPGIMRGVSRRLTPRPTLEAAQIEVVMQRSVNAWLRTTFKAYPLEEVAAENLARQLDAMSDEERAAKMVQIAEEEERKDKQMMFEAMNAAIERVRDEWEAAKEEAEVRAGKERRTKKPRSVLREDSPQFKAMEEASARVRTAWLQRRAESRATA